MAKPDLTRTGFRTPRSFNDQARIKAKIKSFNKFPKIIQGSTPDIVNGGGASAPTYNLTGPATILENGSNNTYTIATANFTGNLYWSINGTTSDFAAISGSINISANTGSFDLTAIADSSTENSESFTISIRTGSISGSVVATKAITVSDTSTGTPAATYSVSGASSSVNEGSALTINVSTANVSDGTTLYWTILGNTGDFSTISDNFTITSDAGSFTVTPTADATTEGTTETFQVQIRTGSTGGTVVDTTDAITINDTSQTPAFSPDYNLSVSFVSTGYYTVAGSDSGGSVSGDNPALTFNAGEKVRFSNSASSAHPLYIKTVQGTGTGNQASGVSGAGTATVDWTIPAGSGTHYYQCSVHNAMYGTITVT